MPLHAHAIAAADCRFLRWRFSLMLFRYRFDAAYYADCFITLPAVFIAHHAFATILRYASLITFR